MRRLEAVSKLPNTGMVKVTGLGKGSVCCGEKATALGHSFQGKAACLPNFQVEMKL